jgi:hypothetical protein
MKRLISAHLIKAPLIRVPFSIVILLGVLFMSACEENDNISIDKGPTALEAAQEAEATQEAAQVELPNTIKLRAAPGLNIVALEWDAETDAVDYKVSRELQGSNNGVIEAFTGGARSFSFSTSGKETYSVWVMAIDSQGVAMSLSKVVNVITADPNAIVISDQGL